MVKKKNKLKLEDIDFAFVYKTPETFKELWDNEIKMCFIDFPYGYKKKTTFLHKHRYIEIDLIIGRTLIINSENFEDYSEDFKIVKKVI